ncbi:MAG TPA: GspE/PulE family protein [Stellaceae bacterium]|jgi:general secretion pathway protein E|nr:GspE/PulE family protein [Stellaceae bacterium]
MQLVDFLIERGRLDAVQRDRVLAVRRERGDGESESVILTRLGMISEREMAQCLADFFGIPLTQPDDYPTAPVPAGELSVDFIARAQILPLGETPEGLALAMADPNDDYTIKAVRLAVGKPVLPWAAVPSELAGALERVYGRGAAVPAAGVAAPAAARADVKRLSDFASEEPVIRYVNWLIGHAAAARASDIHIEASADRVVQRLRVDGLLRDIDPPPSGLHDNIVSRIKVMAGLNIAERRLPQDGRFRVVVEGREIDLRVSIVPTLHGESLVLRLLDRVHAPLDLAELGFSGALREQLMQLLALPSGMLLVTGPTGSGKTSTLYAALQLLNSRERKILTVEDPVEYQLPGINQIPVRPAIGLNFATLLRSLLRQDPDILLVGEIRDLETARIAAQASLTGHLLLSTLHTNDAVGAIIRLVDMGLEEYLIAAVLKGVLAQRLVRCLCPACRQPYRPEPELLRHPRLAALADRDFMLYRPSGCEACGGSGYRGRTAIAELLVFDERLSRCVIAGADGGALIAEAQAGGFVDLHSDGLAKAAAGITSLDEVLRVTGAG